ncbi:hypothetical protein NPIL_115101 [Nephila pilipes]|uniref:Uncharacterized protein n=1 Tax=Nephila pilipes TaxID=299642 RepID=A0A8X6M9S8_NEPPI|nr:hypothetical protein NPIL_115101 [Nephila pilipes]
MEKFIRRLHSNICALSKSCDNIAEGLTTRITEAISYLPVLVTASVIEFLQEFREQFNLTESCDRSIDRLIPQILETIQHSQLATTIDSCSCKVDDLLLEFLGFLLTKHEINLLLKSHHEKNIDTLVRGDGPIQAS